ncbi:PIN domain-containing protein [Glutamicibacter protophormiae]|uniref:PIN domain-containing protein n=1 Tax=Glutamicibacter protophormiae TaxID=37930 RepID=UPI003318A9DC
MTGNMGGLYSGSFSGYRIATNEDKVNAIRTSLVAVDANVLLNLYRYRDQTSNDLLKVFEALGPRLVVPYQALREFWRHRRQRQTSPDQAGREMQSAITSAQNKITSGVEVWAKKTGLTVDESNEFKGQVSEFLMGFSESINEATAPINNSSDSDQILNELERIVEGCVTARPNDDEWQECVIEGSKRVLNEEPPGYMDKKKEENSLNPEGGAGDYLVWYQAINHAKVKNSDLIFITGDEKEDWWWKDRSNFLGPRHELTREFDELTGNKLIFLRPSELLELAGSALEVEPNASSLADADRVAGEIDEDPETELWTADAVAALLEKLDEEAPIQAGALRYAAGEGEGQISREKVFELGEYSDDRMLRGFTRPFKRLTVLLQEQGVVPIGVRPIFIARYPDGVKASYFSIAEEVPSIIGLGDSLK